MAKHGMKLMDSDMHIIEPLDLWERYEVALIGICPAPHSVGQLCPVVQH